MFLYKYLIFCFLIWTSLVSHAQIETTSSSNNDLNKTYIRRTWALSYISWTEMVDFENGSNTDQGFANFYGNSLSYEFESFKKRNSGLSYEADFLFGQTNIGGSQSRLTYQESYKKFMGIMAQAKYVYRPNSAITFSAGPLVLFRQVTVADVNGVTAKVGNPFNFGLIGSLGARLGKNWELRQSFGTIMFKASTIWSVGLGYKY